MGNKTFFSRLITKDLTAVDSSRRLFEGVLTVEMKDRQGEITIRDELLKVLPIWIARGGPITDTHSNRVVGKGINYAATTVTDAEGKTYPAITIQGEIFKDYELDNQIWKAIKDGKYKGLSFGGATKTGRSPILEKDGSIAYSLKDLEQYEVAVCEEPAVPLALITQHNEIAKAMAGEWSDRGDGNMCIRCDKFKCFVEKDALIKIEDEDDKNTEVEVLDEWKNNDNDSGEEKKKNGEPLSDVTGSNKPEMRDEQAEALREEREKEDELENNRGEPQENGSTYRGTDKALDDEMLDPEREGIGATGDKKIPGIKEKTPGDTAGKMEYSQITTEKLASRTHTCDGNWAETKHAGIDGKGDSVGQNVQTCEAPGTNKVKNEGGSVSTGTEGANNPVNSGKPGKKTIPRIIREFEDEGHGDPFDDKAMDEDDKEMLEEAGLEEEKKLEHIKDESDGPIRKSIDMLRLTLELKKKRQTDEYIDDYDPCRATHEGAAQFTTTITDEETGKQVPAKVISGRTGKKQRIPKWRTNQAKKPQVKENPRSRYSGGSKGKVQTADVEGRAAKRPKSEKQIKHGRKQFPFDIDALNRKLAEKKASLELLRMTMEFKQKVESCGSVWTEPGNGNFGREPGVTREQESKTSKDRTQIPVKTEGAEGVKKVDNGMAAHDAENGKKDKVAVNIDDLAESFKSVTNTQDPNSSNGGVRTGAAYDNAQQDTGEQTPRKIIEEECTSCYKDTGNGNDNEEYEK